jgi:uncharacterized UBP type Zn finger protein
MKLFHRKTSRCAHVPSEIASPSGAACEGCGSRFNLRSCAECGYVACCESQRAHNRQHAREARHPVIVSLPLGPHSFTWCYECARYVDADVG